MTVSEQASANGILICVYNIWNQHSNIWINSLLEIIGIWLFGLIWTILPMVGWNRYVPEGNVTACGTDYLSLDWVSKSYILVYSVFVYYTPLFTIIYSYYFIVSTVAAHERGMREQAKKMNVASLRSGEGQGGVSATYFANVFCSHPKYRAALKEKLPFLVCGSTEDQAAAGGEKTSEAAGN